jgi:sterol desaturase/sphingolipid hydroxylase (fatty acid hydroxylase superfamily)
MTMTFMQLLLSSIRGMLPGLLIWGFLPLIPFVLAEQIRPVGHAPRFRDYGMNILIGLSTAYLALPLGILAGLWSGRVRGYLPWRPISFTFDSIGHVPRIGPVLEILAMIFVPLFLHDLWFYWVHRIEHKVPLFWTFHRLHHSDERMNATTYARDHFLQNGLLRAFFPVFTLGLFVDLHYSQAGKAAFYSTMFLICLSMFYHSALRVRLSWLDPILVTPQVHRIHHSTDPQHYNRNFADALPIFDIVFGTYHRPARDEFPATGLGPAFPAPRSIWSAQLGPLLAGVKKGVT